jgi:heme/copper-type cytochrome/quinol oxidase subunit 4
MPSTAQAHETSSVIMAFALVFLLPLPPLWGMLRRNAIKALLMLWIVGVVLLQIEGDVSSFFGMHLQTGTLTVLLFLAPYPIWLVRSIWRFRR